MILKLPSTIQNNTLIPKEATQEKETENFKMQKEKEEKKENQKNSKEENE